MTTADRTGGAPPLSRLRLGTAPDSWGVWHPDDPIQVPWHRFLDEVVEAGYTWIELGPYGYLPTDPGRLRDEVGRRGLSVSGQACFAALHRPNAWDVAVEDFRKVAQLVTALGARHLVYLPGSYRGPDDSVVEATDLDGEDWQRLTTGVSRLAKLLFEEFGVSLVFHPHADTHVETQAQVERFLADTDPELVTLCLDTGHISYRHGDNLELVRRFPDRIGYVHLKQVDPAVIDSVDVRGLSFAQAVRLGAMVEPPLGVPDMEPLLDALAALDKDLFAIVEQDLYPCEPDVPLPIAMRTREYFNKCGLGPVPGRAENSGRSDGFEREAER